VSIAAVSVLPRATGYNLREGALILAARRAENERRERERQAKVRAGFARFALGRLHEGRAVA
jgi:hypothetical protein